MHIYISSTVYIRQQNGYKLYWKHHFWRHETKVFPNFFMGFSSTYIYIYTFLTCGLKLPLCQLWWFANVPLSAAVANFPNKYHWHDELQLRREDVLWATAVCDMMIHSYIHARVEAWVRVASESGNITAYKLTDFRINLCRRKFHIHIAHVFVEVRRMLYVAIVIPSQS